MHSFTAHDIRAALRPIASLIAKSEKAQSHLAPETWQYAMLRDNLTALRIASAIMGEGTEDDADAPRGDLEAALRAVASMIARAEKAQAGFAPGTSQHSLQRNRIQALRVAEAVIAAQLAEG